MIDLKVHINDREVMEYAKKSPQRAQWAQREALKATGGHYRKWLANFIEYGGRGWKPAVKTRYRKQSRRPLEGLARLVRFRVSRIRKVFYRLRVGFFHYKSKRMTSKRYRYLKETFKGQYGMTPQALAKKHEYGHRQRLTRKMKRKMAAMGIPVKRSTKYLQIPARPMIRPLHREVQKTVGGYFKKRFFTIFFSKRNKRLGF